MPYQLPLDFNFPKTASFATYLPSHNAAVCTLLQQAITRKDGLCLFIWGIMGTGKSHLLQAACRQMTQEGKTPAYLPLAYLQQMGTEMMEGLESLDLVCLDDVHLIAGQLSWEQALFHLCNALKEAGVVHLVSAQNVPNQLNWNLPDLASRLSSGGVYALHPLDDDGKIHALQKHAHYRGLELSLEVATYLVHHYSRDMKELVEWLQQLDYASLATRRKLTLPFVRQFLHLRHPKN